MSFLSSIYSNFVPSSSSSSAASTQSAPSYEGLSVTVSAKAREMITPQEQLRRLADTVAGESVGTFQETLGGLFTHRPLDSLVHSFGAHRRPS